jgi:hypothetical protein
MVPSANVMQSISGRPLNMKLEHQIQALLDAARSVGAPNIGSQQFAATSRKQSTFPDVKKDEARTSGRG